MSQHPSNRPNIENVDDLSYYHAPSDDQIKRMKEVADSCKAFLLMVFRNCPECADRTTALREIRNARMWANSAIALERKETDEEQKPD